MTIARHLRLRPPLRRPRETLIAHTRKKGKWDLARETRGFTFREDKADPAALADWVLR